MTETVGFETKHIPDTLEHYMNLHAIDYEYPPMNQNKEKSMAPETALKKKARAHTIYKDAFGNRIPGVTTITGVLNKPALVKWANNLGLQGIDSSAYVDELADVGTLAHKMIEADMQGVQCDTSDYSQTQIDMAENALISYFEWKKDKAIHPIMVEHQMVSGNGFGGTIDVYAKINGKLTLLDIKTSKGIFPEMFTQVAAYQMLLEENGHQVDDVKILRVGREESEGFSYENCPKLDLHQSLFNHCLSIYNLQKELKRKG
jgi:hypothetical protein